MTGMQYRRESPPSQPPPATLLGVVREPAEFCSTMTAPTTRRTVATITRVFWACTSTMTWLLLLLSHSNPGGVSAATPEIQPRSQFDSAFSPDQSRCIHSLLLDRYRIPPAAFTATSELGESTGTRRYSAENIRSEKAELAWCPNRRVGMEMSEYVQVDMGELNAITKIVISGLHAEEGGSRFTPYFYLRYKREMDEPDWRTYRQRDSERTSRLIGSSTALVPKFVVLDPPLIARWIRIYPYRDSPGFVCVRLEAYGCRFTDDLVEYQIPEGSLALPPHHAETPSHLLFRSSTQPQDNNGNSTVYYEAGNGSAFSDTCYDGYRVEPGSLLDGGLGCLTDLAIAPQQTSPSARDSPLVSLSVDEAQTFVNNHWFVGWHRSRWRTTKVGQQRDENDVVDMLFRFATVRDFKRLRLYASNNYPGKVRLPRRIEVRFSVRGSLFSGQPVIAQDLPWVNHSTGVRTIELDLEGRIGRFLQLKAFFADDWLLLSEIKFYSHIAADPVMIDEPIVPRRSKKDPVTPNVNRGEASTALPVESISLTSTNRFPTVIILAILIAAFLVVIGCAFIWIYWKRKRLREAKHRRDLSLRLDGRMEVGDGAGNGRVGGMFPTNVQLITANGTLPRKCSPHGLNDLRHLMEANQTTGGRTISNQNSCLSGTTGPSDEASEADPFTTGSPPHAHAETRSPIRSGFLASLKNSFCPTHKSASKSAGTLDHFGSAHPQTSLPHNLVTCLYDPGALQAYPNSLTMFHGTLPTAPQMTVGSGLNGGASVLPFELSNPANSAMLLNDPATHAGMVRVTAQPNSIVSESHPGSWLMHSGYSNGAINSTGATMLIGGMNPELGLYTTVGGESDGDSNGASTMSQEYATAGNVSDQAGFASAFSQIQQRQQQQQAAAAALLACSVNDMRGHISYMPPRYSGLLSPSLTFSALPTPSTTMVTRTLAQPNPLIFSNPPVNGAQLMMSSGPMDPALTNSVQLSQCYSTNNCAVASSVTPANYLTAGAAKQFAPVRQVSMSIANPALLTRMYGYPEQQPQAQQQQQQTPRLKRFSGVSNFSGMADSRSALNVYSNADQPTPSSVASQLAAEQGLSRFQNGIPDGADPWIRAPFTKQNRFDALNGEHYLSSLRPPIPPSSPPPPPPQQTQSAFGNQHLSNAQSKTVS